MTSQKVYDEVADFIASMNPAKVLELKASKEAQERLYLLIDQEKESCLNHEEN